MRRVAEQLELSQELPVVVGNADYREFRERLERIDELLRVSRLEDAFVERGVSEWMAKGRKPSNQALRRHQKVYRQALRCNVARQLTQKEYRPFSERLADSPLLQWFCQIKRLEQVKVPSKSTLERYDKIVPEVEVRGLVGHLNRMSMAEENVLELAETLDMDAYFSDTTCVKANIHFPTDWVLLRDAVKTLIRAMKVIRKHGLKRRMPEPDEFIGDINKLSIAMSQSRRRSDSVKQRKRVLRRMKRVVKVVRGHAERYRAHLAERWRETDLKEGQMKQILRRIEGVLDQLPRAVRQAHERIIGGRKVDNVEKILSLYEADIHVIVRNKADAEVEFGNTLLLAEQEDGLILDWRLERETSLGDTKLMRGSLERIRKFFGCYPTAAVGDRGFWSAGNREWLEQEKIFDAICPKPPEMLRDRLEDARFCRLQKRRSQTEGRIGILKNDFLGRPLRSKGFEHREMAVAWAVLTHNLWLIAGLPRAKEKRKAA